MTRLRFSSIAACVVFAGASLVAIAGCGGGGSSAVPASTPTPRATPAPLPSGSFATLQATIPANGGAIALPSYGGFSGAINVPPPVSGGGSQVTITMQTTPPPGFPALTGAGRRPLTNTPILYFSVSFASSAVFNTSFGFTLNLPSAALAGVQYFIADSTSGSVGWNLAALGPATVSGSSLTFAQTSGMTAASAGLTIYGALYYTNTPPSPQPSGPVATSAPHPFGTILLSTFNIQSNPSGLQVRIVQPAPSPTATGTTPMTYTPSFSSTAYAISIVPSNGASPFVYTIDQTANGNHVVYYNQNADTNGSIGSVSSTAFSRQTQSVARAAYSGPRFPPLRLSGRPIFSSSRVAVHYLASALRMGGRHPADVERFEGVGRAVDIGFVRDGQATRIVDVPPDQTTSTIVARLKRHAEVAAAEPLQLRYPTSSMPVTPNDKHFDNYQQWDLFRIGAPNAWGYTTGTPQTGNTPSPARCSASGNNATPAPGYSGVAVAILDTGADNTHPDLGPVNGVNKIVYGEKVVGGVVTCGAAAAQDTDGHGTNVSGIAAADTNNSSAYGFAGTGFNVSLQIYKIFPDQTNPSADTGDEAQAIYDAVAHGARIINLSLGGPQGGGYDAVERDAIEYAIAQNVIVVAAAGNEAATTLDFPAGYDGVIAVGATSLNDAPNYKQYSSASEFVASYSNYGPRLTVVAPGGDPPACEQASTTINCPGYSGVDFLHWIFNIYTRTPLDPSTQCSTSGGTDPTRLDCKALFAGTSQATPHVSGAVALLLSKNPALTVAQVVQILESTADDIGDPKQGHGRLNLYRALAQVAGDGGPNDGLPLPPKTAFVAFAYTNSGGTKPAIINQTYTYGVPVASDGTFRIADIAAGAGMYHCAVWADLNGDGKVDAGDWFGVASGTGTGGSPCSGAANIVAHPVSAGFTLP